MKLGTKGRYAVMAVVDVCKHAGSAPVPLSEVAERQGISLSYLEQIFNKLRRQNIVESVRGMRGGYILGRPAEDITLADVMLSVDEPLHATRCAPRATSGCLGKGHRCALHEVWEELSQRIYGYLASVSLADVVNGSPKSPASASLREVPEHNGGRKNAQENLLGL